MNKISKTKEIPNVIVRDWRMIYPFLRILCGIICFITILSSGIFITGYMIFAQDVIAQLLKIIAMLIAYLFLVDKGSEIFDIVSDLQNMDKVKGEK